MYNSGNLLAGCELDEMNKNVQITRLKCYLTWMMNIRYENLGITNTDKDDNGSNCALYL